MNEISSEPGSAIRFTSNNGELDWESWYDSGTTLPQIKADQSVKENPIEFSKADFGILIFGQAGDLQGVFMPESTGYPGPRWVYETYRAYEDEQVRKGVDIELLYIPYISFF